MPTELNCPHCAQHISVAESVAGNGVECPSCGNSVPVPATLSPTPDQQPSADTIFCPKCGEQNVENNFKCTRCGFVLHGPAQPQVAVSDDSTLGGLIPYKNPQALWAYYLGIFSLIPCLGIPLGIAAFVLGIRGLRYADLHTEARGKGHAWAGIILGGLCAVAYTVLAAALMIGIAAE